MKRVQRRRKRSKAEESLSAPASQLISKLAADAAATPAEGAVAATTPAEEAAIATPAEMGLKLIQAYELTIAMQQAATKQKPLGILRHS